MTSKPLLVGESNPYGGDDRHALYPAPHGCAGHRLCWKILGMWDGDYLESFDRVNLCVGKWSQPAARAQAKVFAGRRVILLGAKVASAFGMQFIPFITATEQRGNAPVTSMVVLPHPSGLCRLWHKPDSFAKARAAILKMCPELADVIGKVPSKC